MYYSMQAPNGWKTGAVPKWVCNVTLEYHQAPTVNLYRWANARSDCTPFGNWHGNWRQLWLRAMQLWHVSTERLIKRSRTWSFCTVSFRSCRHRRWKSCLQRARSLSLRRLLKRYRYKRTRYSCPRRNTAVWVWWRLPRPRVILRFLIGGASSEQLYRFTLPSLLCC